MTHGSMYKALYASLLLTFPPRPSRTYEYEEQTVDIPAIYGVEMLEVLTEEFGLRQKDLTNIFKTESIVSDVLNRKRNLTVEHSQKLASFFHLSPAVFFERTGLLRAHR